MTAQADVERRLPDFVVIGAQKAGSTYLADRLGELDEVHVPRLEIPYFEAPFFQNSDERELWRAFEQAEPTDLKGLKRADYLSRPEVPGNLAQVVPDAALIAVLRPPVQRTVSAVYWYMLHGQLDPVGLNANLERILERHEAGTLSGPALEIITNSRYADGLDRYREVWDAERIVVVDSRRIDHDVTYQRLAGPLGLPGTAWPAPPVTSRANVGVYNLRRLQLLRLRSKLVYDWRKSDTFVYKSHPAMYRPVRASIALVPKLIDQLVLDRLVDNEPEELAPDLREALSELFAPDLERLVATYGIDLDADLGQVTT